MAREFNPPPIQQPFLVNGRMSEAWLRWFHQIREHVRADGSIAWDSVDKTGSSLAGLATRLFTDLQFTGSNLTSLATRLHNDLQSAQGGASAEYYHLTAAQHTEVTGFFGATDITGAEAETLTDGSAADALHTHAPLKKTVDEKSAAYTVVAGDLGKVINVDATGGPITLTLTAAATLGDGFWCYVRKADVSANAVTIDPNGAETVNGAATASIGTQFQMRLLVCDGAGWFLEV